MKSPPSLQQAALTILGRDPAGPPIAQTMQAVYDLMEEMGWDGACHALSAVMFVLLREQGIHATLHLGEVGLDGGYFDHSWIEINEAVFDVAVARPLEPALRHPPVVAGCHVHDGQPTRLAYGAVSGLAQDSAAARRRGVKLGEYMDGFPDHPQGLWGIAAELGVQLGLNVSARSLRQRYGHDEWTTRTSSASPADRKRERNRRKRERRGR